MEAGQDEDAATGSKEQNHIAKGKRTKRQRLQSLTEPDNHVCNFSSTSFNANTDDDGEREQEDQDMANCLILLAQGRWLNSPKQLPQPPSSFKPNSRRFMETAHNSTGKVGYYVYECKTCSRTFPSFQALGGHRASHKKPLKIAMAGHEKKLISDQFSPEIEEEDEEAEFKNNSSTPLEIRLSRSNSFNKLGNKVHGCSICGAEFLSGQALGGHMRRHRRGLGTKNGALSMASMEEAKAFGHKKQRSLSSLDLDLNLPAPDDDHREQPAIVFPAPALVGCHY